MLLVVLSRSVLTCGPCSTVRHEGKLRKTLLVATIFALEREGERRGRDNTISNVHPNVTLLNLFFVRKLAEAGRDPTSTMARRVRTRPGTDTNQLPKLVTASLFLPACPPSEQGCDRTQTSACLLRLPGLSRQRRQPHGRRCPVGNPN